MIVQMEYRAGLLYPTSNPRKGSGLRLILHAGDAVKNDVRRQGIEINNKNSAAASFSISTQNDRPQPLLQALQASGRARPHELLSKRTKMIYSAAKKH